MRPGISAWLARVLSIFLAAPSPAADWPAWRCDARRSAATPHALPSRLHLQWVRQLPPLAPAWPDQPKLQADAVYEPVVLGKRLFVGSSRHDTLTAYHTDSGRELWHFHAEGPIRYAPVAAANRVYFVADDGYLYCVDAVTGALVWKFRGGPSDRRVLGNGRLISIWPARGGPVLTGGTVTFAAGIWPFMGIFIHAVDARTGKAIWTNDGDGSVFIKQPHNADSFGGVAPQGALVVTGDKLLVPGGRSVPACLDRKTGKLLYYRLGENGKRGGGSEVVATGKCFFNGGTAFEVESGMFLGTVPGPLVADGGVLYSAVKGGVSALDLNGAAEKETETVDRKGKKVKVSRWTLAELGSAETFAASALIKAGDRLYLGGDGEVAAVFLPLKKGGQAVTWRATVRGTISSLLAADDKLFAVTRAGRLYCFGAERVQPREHAPSSPPLPVKDVWIGRAREILQASGVREGFCVVWGVGNGRLIEELARQSELRIIAVDADGARVGALRDRLQATGVPAARVAVHVANPLTFPLPPYLASLVVAETLPPRPELLGKVFHVLRPYGGVACLALPTAKHRAFARLVAEASLPNAKLRSAGDRVLLSRGGALPGSADWTHEHADAANSRVSKDQLVKAPLGILWFGGPSHDGILPRHGHGPQPQVCAGRLIIEGVDMLRATDVYTGRILWEATLPGVGAFYNNLMHQPGANAGGTNYITLPDGIYVAYGKVCVRLDPATGKNVSEFRLPALPPHPSPSPPRGEGRGEGAPAWGYLNVVDDYLIAGADPLFNVPSVKPMTRKDREGKDVDDDDDVLARLKSKAARALNDNLSSSKHLIVLDRHTGKVLWRVTAESGFRHNAICAGGGRLYCIDRLSGPQLSRLKRRGEEPKTKPRLLAFDLKTGRALWKTGADVFGTWVSYSARRDILVESGRVARDTLLDEPQGMRAYRAADGKVLWVQTKYAGPAMLHGDTILMAGKACDLLTGARKMRKDPLTEQLVEWTWTRGYGCNTPAASEHLLTFRSGAAGYYDLAGDGGTGNFGGFRSGCTNNLIVANGVLSAPDCTRTCVCNYQNQSSLALVHTPDAEMWTFFSTSRGKGPVRRLGLNLGAPGARRAEDGTLWLPFPRVGREAPAVTVTTLPAKPEVIRRHTSQVAGAGPQWVGASAVKGLYLLTVDLANGKQAERRYTVRLHFAELEAVGPGERLFDVGLQGETVLRDFDVVKEAGGRNRSVVKQFKGIKVSKELVLTFSPSTAAKVGAALLNGLEIVEEKTK